MIEINQQEVSGVSGGMMSRVGVCEAGTSIAFGIMGGAVGAYSTFGLATGAGFGWGMSIGGVVGDLACSTFFAD